jgi:antitoxin HicB
MENKHVGSSFDDFLQEEGLMAEAEATALKRVLAYQIKQEMEFRHLTKTALAKMMKTSRSSVDRLLDPNNSSITLLTLENVAVALGKKLKLQFV